MTCVTHAQPQSSKPKSYPNTENFGLDVAPDTPWLQECLRVEQVKSSEPAPALPASCNAFNYYDKRQQAVTTSAEWAGVRACALASGDNSVLAMLYANGRGVPRNLDLATQYACRSGGAYAEVAGRIAHLQALQTSAPGTETGEKEWLREHLYAFEKGNINPAPAQALAIADAELNRVYQHLMAAPVSDRDQPDRFPDSTVNKTAVRATQRLWLAYRDAWVRFAALRYPTMSPDALKAVLTEWRTKQLARMD